MSFLIKGVNVTLPLDLVGSLFSGLRNAPGQVHFRKGSRYQLNGAWFRVEQVLETGLVMRLVNPKVKTTEEIH